MEANDVVIMGFFLLLVSIFVWFILRLLTNNNINKFNLELSEWVTINVERNANQKNRSMPNAAVKHISISGQNYDNDHEISDLWSSFERNLNNIAKLASAIKANQRDSTSKFPITIDVLRKMKYLRTRFESVASANNITKAELSELTDSSFEVIRILNELDQQTR